MYTKIEINGTIIEHVTQQYTIGTYIIINNDPSLQGSSQLTEEKYHLQLRKKVIKDKDAKLIGGTILNYTGELPINNFEK